MTATFGRFVAVLASLLSNLKRFTLPQFVLDVERRMLVSTWALPAGPLTPAW